MPEGIGLMDALEQLKLMDIERKPVMMTLEERLLVGAILRTTINHHDEQC